MAISTLRRSLSPFSVPVAHCFESSDPLGTVCQVLEVKRVKKQAAMRAKAQDLKISNLIGLNMGRSKLCLNGIR